MKEATVSKIICPYCGFKGFHQRIWVDHGKYRCRRHQCRKDFMVVEGADKEVVETESARPSEILAREKLERRKSLI